MSTAQLSLAFNYADLDSETRIVVQQKTGEIKERIKRTASDLVEIGERLKEIKERLGHGQFERWAKMEFEWSERTAYNLIAVADAFIPANFAGMSIDRSALYALSAPSVPQAARDEAIAVASNGHHVPHSQARAIIDRHKPEPSKPRPVADLYAEEDDVRQEEVETAEPVRTKQASPQKHPLIVALDDLSRVISTVEAATGLHSGGFGGIEGAVRKMSSTDREQARVYMNHAVETVQGWIQYIESIEDES